MPRLLSHLRPHLLPHPASVSCSPSLALTTNTNSKLRREVLALLLLLLHLPSAGIAGVHHSTPVSEVLGLNSQLPECWPTLFLLSYIPALWFFLSASNFLSQTSAISGAVNNHFWALSGHRPRSPPRAAEVNDKPASCVLFPKWPQSKQLRARVPGSRGSLLVAGSSDQAPLPASPPPLRLIAGRSPQGGRQRDLA